MHVRTKSGKLKCQISYYYQMIQEVLEKFWKYIESKRKKGKNIAKLCNGEKANNSRKMFDIKWYFLPEFLL